MNFKIVEQTGKKHFWEQLKAAAMSIVAIGTAQADQSQWCHGAGLTAKRKMPHYLPTLKKFWH